MKNVQFISDAMSCEQFLTYSRGFNKKEYDALVNFICESQELDENLKDAIKTVWNNLQNVLNTPIDCVKKILSKDRFLVSQTAKNLKLFKKADLASIYSYEFANTNIIDDLWDMLCMFKDILLFRYKKIPWRTVLSACVLLAYIISPYGIEAGTLLYNFIDTSARAAMKGAAAVGILGGSGIAGNTYGLATLFSKKHKGLSTDEAWKQAWDQITHGTIAPETLKQITPYLNALDELLIVFVLWKWFKNDLREYRMWLIAKDETKKIIDNKQLDNELIEGEGGGAMAAGGEGGGAMSSGSSGDHSIASEMNSGKITSVDVLGKIDLNKGFMGKGDFHIPKKIRVPFHRWECCNGGSKRKKTKNGKDKKYYHEKNMKIITSYNDLVESEDANLIFVFNIKGDKLNEIFKTSKITNKRFNPQQFLKYKQNSEIEYVALFSEFPKQCLAMAALSYNKANCNDCYICEIQCLVNGYGKVLLNKILKSQENVWFMANPEEKDTLISYYKQPMFDLNEYVLDKSIYNKPIHFFYTKSCPEDKLKRYIDDTYIRTITETNLDAFQNSSFTDLDNVSFENTEWKELSQNDVTPIDNVYIFGYDQPAKKDKYIYSAHIESINHDPELSYDEQVTSDKPLSLKDIFDKLWKKAARKYSLPEDMMIAHREFDNTIHNLKAKYHDQAEFLSKVAELKFPAISELYYGNATEDGIHIVPDKDTCQQLTDQHIPAGYFEIDNDINIKFNKFATDKIFIETVIGQ